MRRSHDVSYRKMIMRQLEYSFASLNVQPPCMCNPFFESVVKVLCALS